jgi:hypothetical protein
MGQIPRSAEKPMITGISEKKRAPQGAAVQVFRGLRVYHFRLVRHLMGHQAGQRKIPEVL